MRLDINDKRPRLDWPSVALLILTAALSISRPTHAQTRVTGTVRDASTQLALGDVRIEVVDRRIRSVTDSMGAFILDRVPRGTYSIRFSRIGYHFTLQQITIADSTAITLSVTLEPASYRLSDIVVSPGQFGIMETQVQAQRTLSREDIETIPQIGEDIFRATKRIPGVASDDISTRLFVRGGTDQELLVLLDGLELYEPYHLKDFDGALGIIDVNSIGGVNLVAGGFPARYGDKLTGVYDMTSRTPPVTGMRTSVGLSITNASFMNQGAFNSGNGQWLLSARRGYLDIALALTGGNENISPQYGDVFGKFQYQIHQNHRVGIAGLFANDQLTFVDDDGEVTSGWNSGYGWLTWDAQFAPQFTSRTVGYVGRVTRDRAGGLEDPGRIRGPELIDVDDQRDFDIVGVKQDFGYELSPQLLLQLGGEFSSGTADYDYFNTTSTSTVTPGGTPETTFDTVSVTLVQPGDEFTVYAGVRFRPVSPLTAEIGVRYDKISHTGDEDVAPRISVAWDITGQTTLRASWGTYYQSHGVHELDVGDGETEYFGSDNARLAAVGLQHRFGADLDVRIEAYRREMRDQRPRYVNADREIDAFPEAEGDRIRIDPDGGLARGIEFMISHDRGRRWAWSASYVLASAEDDIDEVWTPRVLDQRHTIGVHVIMRPSDRWQLSAGFQWHTGWPATESTFAVDTLTDGSLKVTREFGQLNTLRLPAYHRLDVRATRDFYLGNNLLQVYLDIFNVYNRANLRSYGYNVRVDNGTLTVTRVGGEELLPILPSIGLRFEF